MTAKNVFELLNIPENRVKLEDNKYIVDLKDSDEYARLYTTLDNMSELEIIPDETVMDTDDVQLSYVSEDLKEDAEIGSLSGYKITLSGNLDNNSYKLELEEK